MRRARAHAPAFRQLGASTRLLLAATIGEYVQTDVPSRTPASHRPSRQATAPLVEIPASSVFHLVDESS